MVGHCWSHRVVLAGVAVALAGACLAGRAAAADTTPQFVRAWGSLGSGQGQFNYPGAIRVAKSGNVYVADTNNHRIQVFSNTGEFLFMWGSFGTAPGQFQYPQGLAFDATGNVYVTDYQNYRIQKFTPDGQFILQFGGPGKGDGQFGTTNTSMEGPYGIAVDAAGDVYVGDQGNNRVQKFTANGQFLTKWGSYGSGAGQFRDEMSGMCVDAQSNVYVADPRRNDVQAFSSYGTYLTAFHPAAYVEPRDMALLPDGRIAVLIGGCGVQIYRPDGSEDTSWGACGNLPGEFYGPYGMALDGLNNYFIADTYAHRIQQFAADYVPVRSSTWGTIKAIYR